VQAADAIRLPRIRGSVVIRDIADDEQVRHSCHEQHVLGFLAQQRFGMADRLVPRRRRIARSGRPVGAFEQMRAEFHQTNRTEGLHGSGAPSGGRRSRSANLYYNL
jgi:hypothetical protein